MTDPYELLSKRLKASERSNGRDPARDAAVKALQDRWLTVYSDLAQEARALVDTLREEGEASGDVRATEYGFSLRLAATVGGGRRECTVGFPHALRAADIHLVEGDDESGEPSAVAWIKLPACDHEVSFSGAGVLGWIAEDGEPAKADSRQETELRGLLSDLVAQELFSSPVV